MSFELSILVQGLFLLEGVACCTQNDGASLTMDPYAGDINQLIAQDMVMFEDPCLPPVLLPDSEIMAKAACESSLIDITKELGVKSQDLASPAEPVLW